MSYRDNTLAAVLASNASSVTLDYRTEVYVEDCAFSKSVRSTRSPRTGRHGARFTGPAKFDAGVWSATLRVRGDAWSIDENRAAVEGVLGELIDGDGSLTWAPRRGSARALSGLRLLDSSWKADGSSYLCSVQIESEKPYAEDTTATTVESAALNAGGGGFTVPLTIPFTLTASSGGDLSVTHAGDFVQAFPILRAYGPITNPNVILRSTDERLVFDGSIASGDYWEIDLFAGTVRQNGLTRVTALDVGASTWFGIPRGTAQLQLAGAGYSASTKLQALMKSTWG